MQKDLIPILATQRLERVLMHITGRPNDELPYGDWRITELAILITAELERRRKNGKA